MAEQIGIALVRPVDPGTRVSQTFEDHITRPHTGRVNGAIDFACPVGSPVYAAFPSSAFYVAEDAEGPYGLNLRMVDGSGTWMAIYAHLERIKVKRGEWVEAGDEIAKSGNTGDSSGPHLHFELRYYPRGVDVGQGIPVNPEMEFEFTEAELPSRKKVKRQNARKE